MTVDVFKVSNISICFSIFTRLMNEKLYNLNIEIIASNLGLMCCKTCLFLVALILNFYVECLRYRGKMRVWQVERSTSTLKFLRVTA